MLKCFYQLHTLTSVFLLGLQVLPGEEKGEGIGGEG